MWCCKSNAVIEQPQVLEEDATLDKDVAAKPVSLDEDDISKNPSMTSFGAFFLETVNTNNSTFLHSDGKTESSSLLNGGNDLFTVASSSSEVDDRTNDDNETKDKVIKEQVQRDSRVQSFIKRNRSASWKSTKSRSFGRKSDAPQDPNVIIVSPSQDDTHISTVYSEDTRVAQNSSDNSNFFDTICGCR